jgi:hypothetical protein
MAAQKSIAKGAGPHRAASQRKAADHSRRANKSRSSAKSRTRRPKPRRGSQRGDQAYERRAELLETLSSRLSLVETASLALQKFEEDAGIGGVCASLEHAVRMLAEAHEQVEHYLLGRPLKRGPKTSSRRK